MTSKRSFTIAASMFALALSFMPNAIAQCGLPAKLVHPANWHPQSGQAALMEAALTSDESGRMSADAASIVGMWHVTFTAKTMNGSSIGDTVIDDALVVWHRDKTEIMNSARPPQDGNFCMGVWERVGNSNKYKLNHFARGNEYAPGTPNGVVGDPAGPTHIVEYVTLSHDGDHFSGTFTLDAYDTSGKNISTSFTGAITATRITMATTVGDLL
jgi:hypothetical protein